MTAIDRRSLIAGLASATVLPCVTFAQSWPDKPIRMIVSQAAGSTPDILCRYVSERVGTKLGQTIVVENRPGAGNAIAAQTVARAAPDGYTLLWATAATLVSNPHTFKSLSYDPVKDFVPVGKVADGPFVLLAHPSVPANSLPDLIAYAKGHTAGLSIATDGPRNFSGLLAAWISKLSAMNLQQVPYANMPQGIQDTLAGRVQLIILAIPSAAAFMAAGQLKPIAVSTRDRVPGYDKIAPVAETFPDFDFSGWMSVAAPLKTPLDVVEKINRAMDATLKEPEVKSKLAEIGFFTQGAGTLADIQQYVQGQYDAFGKIIQAIGLQSE